MTKSVNAYAVMLKYKNGGYLHITTHGNDLAVDRNGDVIRVVDATRPNGLCLVLLADELQWFSITVLDDSNKEFGLYRIEDFAK